MDPNEVLRLVTPDHDLTEDAICFDICIPAFRIEVQLRRKIVKDRPESLIGVALVEARRHIAGEVDRKTAVGFRPSCKNRLTTFAIVFLDRSVPPDPLSTSFSKQRAHGAGETSRASGCFPAFFSFL